MKEWVIYNYQGNVVFRLSEDKVATPEEAIQYYCDELIAELE